MEETLGNIHKRKSGFAFFGEDEEIERKIKREDDDHSVSLVCSSRSPFTYAHLAHRQELVVCSRSASVGCPLS